MAAAQSHRSLSIDPDNGEPTAGTYIRAKLNSGKTNGTTPGQLSILGDRVVVAEVSPAFALVDINGNRFDDATKNANSTSPSSGVPSLTAAPQAPFAAKPLAGITSAVYRLCHVAALSSAACRR